MSKIIENLDMDNLTEDEKQWLRDRISLGFPQPPEDEAYVPGPQDWNEDDHETVPVSGAPNDNDGGASAAGTGAVNDDGDPVKDDGSYEWNRMTVPRLKEFAEAYELPKSGNKSELVARLEEYDTLANKPEE